MRENGIVFLFSNSLLFFRKTRGSRESECEHNKILNEIARRNRNNFSSVWRQQTTNEDRKNFEFAIIVERVHLFLSC